MKTVLPSVAPIGKLEQLNLQTRNKILIRDV